jgi:putative aldouronate transport system substrate-binding protein
MRKINKKIILAVSIILLLSAVSIGSAEEKEKPATFSVFILTPSQQPAPDNRIFKAIKDQFGISFQFDILAGDLDQKLGVMIASGDYPDIIDSDLHQRFIGAGVLIPLEDLINKYAPNLKKHYEKAWYLMKHKDGHVYVLPNYGVFQGNYMYNESWGPAFWIQKAVLKEFGYPKPKTLDEYFDLIKKYKDKYPTIDGQPTIGFEILSEGWRDFCLRNPPEHLVGRPNEGDVIVDNDVAHIFADKDIAKRYYKKLNDMNKLGLIDKETFVLSYDQYMAKLTSGRVLGMFDQRWNFKQAEDSLKAQDRYLRSWAPCPVTYDKSIRDYYMDRGPVNADSGFGISNKCKDPVRVIKLLEALFTEEWQKSIYWGTKGVDYMVDKNGRFYRTPEQRTKADDPSYRQRNEGLQFSGQIPKMEGTFSDGNATSPGLQPEEYFASLKPVDKELIAAYGYKTFADFFSKPPENPVHYPVWSIPLVDGSPAKLANLKLIELGQKYLPRCILTTPDKFDSVWDSYVKEIKKVDVKAYEDAINEGIRERVKNATKK